MMQRLENIEDAASFDVIVLEYDDLFHDVILSLIDRLKIRYPFARVIVIDLFLLVNYIHTPSGQNLRTLFQTAPNTLYEQFAQRHGLTPDERKNIIQLIRENASPGVDLSSSWKMNKEGVYLQEQLDTMVHHGAAVIRPMYADNVIFAVRDLGEYFSIDMNHYSEAGHALIAEAVLR
eukprot:CAMPEP_0194142822 /NCGR_PEP_ID=MMETSP0152-20130528/12034_1 /TAXON_ID=1049557 /ORGANISM="Thalassiothrix antarctica, Strain L6-D1" /LENGTH=176 /DNA_ID=CAMNT_0038841923 /DNA_START=75 /DNA_END=601 /DNA_ORIENTATION=+